MWKCRRERLLCMKCFWGHNCFILVWPISLWPKRYLFHFSAHLEMNMSSLCTVSNYTQNRGAQIFSTWLLWKCQHLDGGWSFIMCWTPQQECIPYNHPHIVLGLNSITMQVHWRLNKAVALHHHDTPVLCIHKAWVTVHYNAFVPFHSFYWGRCTAV